MAPITSRTRSLFPLLLACSALSADPASAFPRRHLSAVESCTLTRTTYHPSALETQWTNNVAEWAAPGITDYCSKITPHLPDIKAWLTTIDTLMADAFARPTSPHTAATMDLLSHFTYHFECGGLPHTQRSPIEPLFGGLRHPLHYCDPDGVAAAKADSKLSAQDATQKWLHALSKEYLLLQSAYGPPVAMREEVVRAFIFDLGASTYIEGLGGTSQQWFVDRYKERGFTFDGYYAWEATSHTPQQILEHVPADLMPHYLYFNVPASTGLEDPKNPLNMLKKVVKVTDFVVVKIDIDNSPIELQFIDQILNDPPLAALIDELFFEHHVNFLPMNNHWGTENEAQKLSDSYAIFAKLRQMGIRAHGWV